MLLLLNILQNERLIKLFFFAFSFFTSGMTCGMLMTLIMDKSSISVEICSIATWSRWAMAYEKVVELEMFSEQL
jgi:hypothetical protein